MRGSWTSPKAGYEFQVLYGMAEPVRKGLRNVAGRVRLYCPYGKLIPGMAYLVRRLLENTANESFLRQSFADGAAVELLMENPAVTLERELAARQEKAPPNEEGPFPPFRNEPPVDFTIPEKRKAYAQGIAAVRAGGGPDPAALHRRQGCGHGNPAADGQPRRSR